MKKIMFVYKLIKHKTKEFNALCFSILCPRDECASIFLKSAVDDCFSAISSVGDRYYLLINLFV